MIGDFHDNNTFCIFENSKKDKISTLNLDEKIEVYGKWVGINLMIFVFPTKKDKKNRIDV